MGLYNFQSRFVPLILSGEKTHTIRAWRKHSDWVGDRMHLYTGLRRKGAKLLGRPKCVKVEEIHIWRVGDAWPLSRNTRKQRRRKPQVRRVGKARIRLGDHDLTRSECESFARRDGFTSFADMMQFWTGRLPFYGAVYHWEPLKIQWTEPAWKEGAHHA